MTPEETENGLEEIIETIVEKVMEKEAEFSRELTFPELRELMMDMLNEISPRTTYII